jgi:hypothetical protein
MSGLGPSRRTHRSLWGMSIYSYGSKINSSEGILSFLKPAKESKAKQSKWGGAARRSSLVAILPAAYIYLPPYVLCGTFVHTCLAGYCRRWTRPDPASAPLKTAYTPKPNRRRKLTRRIAHETERGKFHGLLADVSNNTVLCTWYDTGAQTLR